MTGQRTKRRILRKIRIDEISGVDRPAQEHARAVIMKRDDAEDAADRTLDDRIEALIRADEVEAVLAKAAEALATPRLSRSEQQTQDRKEPPMADLEDLASNIAKRDGVGATEALRRARREHPAAFQSYNTAPVAKRELDQLDMDGDEGDDGLEARAREIRLRDGCSGTEALRRARREHPEAYERLRAEPLAKSARDFDALVAEEIRRGCPASVAGQRVINKFGVMPP